METPRLRLGVFATFTGLGFAGIVGLVAVFAADSVPSGFGRGVGISVLVFLSGATLVCALACLARRRAEVAALGGVAAAGLGLDLLVLAIWLDIESEAYGKVAGIAFAWALYALLGLGLSLAVRPAERLARALYGGSIGATILAGLLSTWLIATAGDTEISLLTPTSDVDDDQLLRLLGASFVVLASLWLSALAAGRLERQR
jgi:hypothetical protein